MADYASIKNALIAAGYPVSIGIGWTGLDIGSYNSWFANTQAFAAGIPASAPGIMYGLAFPSELPSIISADTPVYTNTISVVPGAGNTVTITLVESNGRGTSFAWSFGDGNTATTSVPTVTYTYSVPGSYTPSCVSTIDGVPQGASNAVVPILAI